jgi:hypothetical protein
VPDFFDRWNFRCVRDGTFDASVLIVPSAGDITEIANFGFVCVSGAAPIVGRRRDTIIELERCNDDADQ